MRSSRAIRAAMRSQALGDGDNETALAVSQLYELAEKHFPALMDKVLLIYQDACERNGRMVVVDKLSGISRLLGSQKPIVRSYFATHNADNPVPEDERTKLGPDVMSFTLQSIDHPEMRKIFMANNGAAVTSSSETESVNRVTSVSKNKWQKRELMVGSCGSNELSDAFTDPRALKITLLLNCLLNTQFWTALTEVTLDPYNFQIPHIGEELEAEHVFELLTFRANEIFEFLDPILRVTIKKDSGDGGTMDIVVEVCGRNERQERHSECTAILELANPCMTYRAANILVFGDKPPKEDYGALERYIATADPLTEEKIKEASTQLELSSSGLSKVHQPLVKRAIVFRDENNKPVYGYTRDGEDITDKLRYCSLESSMDDFHSRLGNVSRRAVLNACPHIALSDGFTLIAMHLRDLKENESGLIEANFDSHCAIDLTETGSSLQIFQYIINAGYRSDRLRRGVEILLHTAHEVFGEHEITADTSIEFNKQLKILSDYKFHSRSI